LDEDRTSLGFKNTAMKIFVAEHTGFSTSGKENASKIKEMVE
jgi:hypothetical protein